MLYIVLPCRTPHHPTLLFTTLLNPAVHFITLPCRTPHYPTMQCSTLLYPAGHHTTLPCSALHYSSLQCSTLEHCLPALHCCRQSQERVEQWWLRSSDNGGSQEYCCTALVVKYSPVVQWCISVVVRQCFRELMM